MTGPHRPINDDIADVMAGRIPGPGGERAKILDTRNLADVSNEELNAMVHGLSHSLLDASAEILRRIRIEEGETDADGVDAITVFGAATASLHMVTDEIAHDDEDDE